jgi:uncharacterized protein (DUF1778 family)
MSKAHQKAVEKYNSLNYDRLTFRVKKEDTEIIRQAAAVAGETLNSFIYKSVMDRIEREAPKELEHIPIYD